MRICAAALGAAATMAVAGCGGGGGGAAAASATSCDAGCWHASAADEQFADSFCALIAPCCARQLPSADGGSPDYAGMCKAKLVRKGFTRNDALRSACLADLRAAAAAPACLPDAANVAASCNLVFYEPSGPLAPGGHCAVAGDCAGRAGALTICEPLTIAPAACVTVAAGQAGDACLGDVHADGVIQVAPYVGGSAQNVAYTGLYCANAGGLVCLPATDPAKGYVCTPTLSAGSPCMFSRACSSHWCATSTGSEALNAPGTCATSGGTLGVGAQCLTNRDCAGGNCWSSVCSPLPIGQDWSQLAFCSNL